LSKGNQYTEAPKGFLGNNKWMIYGGYRIMVGPGRNPFFLNMISQIKNRMEACIIALTSKGGKGKSYLALRLAEILDSRFDPKIQVVYDRKQMMDLFSDTSPLRRWQVVVIDEATMSMGSRNWHEQMQKDLMEQMEAIRSKGLIIIIVTLGVDLLDIILRKHVINYRIHMERKGVGTVYSYDSHRFTGDEIVKKLGEVRFLLPGWEECQCLTSCLVCEYSGLRKGKWKQKPKWNEIGFKPCNNMRNRYEIMKKDYVELRNRASVERANEEDKKKAKVDKKIIVEYLLKLNTRIKLNRNGNTDVLDLRDKVEAGFPELRVSRDVMNEIRRLYESQIEQNVRNMTN
jgi:hypothetical protein